MRVETMHKLKRWRALSATLRLQGAPALEFTKSYPANTDVVLQFEVERDAGSIMLPPSPSHVCTACLIIFFVVRLCRNCAASFT